MSCLPNKRAKRKKIEDWLYAVRFHPDKVCYGCIIGVWTSIRGEMPKFRKMSFVDAYDNDFETLVLCTAVRARCPWAQPEDKLGW